MPIKCGSGRLANGRWGRVSSETIKTDAESEQRDTCRSCGIAFEEPMRRGPFGFRTVTCPGCFTQAWYPLSKRMLIFYWLIVVLTVSGAFAALGSGGWVIPGGVSLVAAVVLILDARLQNRMAPALIVTTLITTTMVLGIVGALLAAGLGNGYSFVVVDRAAAETERFDGIALRSSDQICKGGDDYSTCVSMHVAVYNSVCVSMGWPPTAELTASASETCRNMLSFIEDAKAQIASCGYGCTTRADSDGRWGYSYLQPISIKSNVSIDKVSHREYCLFSLGRVTLGNCPNNPE